MIATRYVYGLEVSSEKPCSACGRKLREHCEDHVSPCCPGACPGPGRVGGHDVYKIEIDIMNLPCRAASETPLRAGERIYIDPAAPYSEIRGALGFVAPHSGLRGARGFVTVPGAAVLQVFLEVGGSYAFYRVPVEVVRRDRRRRERRRT